MDKMNGWSIYMFGHLNNPNYFLAFMLLGIELMRPPYKCSIPTILGPGHKP
jgi:hypothetical protein